MRLKLCICFVLLTLIAFSGTYSFAAESVAPIEVFINSSRVTFTDAQPFINRQGRTMVPLRMVSESFGAKVEWDEQPMHITITNGNRKVEFSARLSENYFCAFGITDLKTNKSKYIDLTDKSIVPVIIAGRSYVPLRTIGEGFGFKANWDGVACRVDIDTTVTSDLYARNPALYDKYYMVENDTPDYKIDKEELGGDSKTEADREKFYKTAKQLIETAGNINYSMITPNAEKYGMENPEESKWAMDRGYDEAKWLQLRIDNYHNAVQNTIVEEAKFISTPSNVKLTYGMGAYSGNTIIGAVVTGKLQFIFREPTSKKYLGGFAKIVETGKWYETDITVRYTYGRITMGGGYSNIVGNIILGKDWTEIQN